MCIILIAEKEKPSLEILEKCEQTNSHGIGIAWLNDNNLAEYRKNITLEKTYELTQSLELPFCVHMRLASCGGHSELLCHPFEVSKDSPLKLEGECEKLLMHNGHVHGWEKFLAAKGIYLEKDSKEPMSDTRAIAMIIAENERFLSLLDGNFVLFDGPNHKIKMYGNFTEENGIHFSNMHWKFIRHHIFEDWGYGNFPEPMLRANPPNFNNQNNNNSQTYSNIASKKERKRLKKYYNSLFNKGVEENQAQLPTRIHEQPLNQNGFSDNIKKILGYTIT